MPCSLQTAYNLIAVAIAMLAAAVAAALIFFNVPGLAVAVGLVLAVSGIPFTDLGLIPQIRKAIQAYQDCRGPESRCTLNHSIDLLGQAAAIVSVFSWLAALALQITALGFITSVFLSWLGVAPLAAGEALKWSGIAGAVACSIILVGLVTQLRAYEACRDAVSPSEEDVTSPIN
jgi:membrane protein YdbS with pleckstrin-like domain